jgi:hypothetical protein
MTIDLFSVATLASSAGAQLHKFNPKGIPSFSSRLRETSYLGTEMPSHIINPERVGRILTMITLE